jgi:hypothetical protein
VSGPTLLAQRLLASVGGPQLGAGLVAAGLLSGGLAAWGLTQGTAPGTPSALLPVYPCPTLGTPLLEAPPGQRLLVTGRTPDGAWLRVFVPAPGRSEGWVRAAEVTLQGDSSSLPTATCGAVAAVAATPPPFPGAPAQTFAGTPPPSVGPTPTATPTATPSPSAPASAVPSPSPRPSPRGSPRATATPSPTPRRTSSPSPSPTPTPTAADQTPPEVGPAALDPTTVYQDPACGPTRVTVTVLASDPESGIASVALTVTNTLTGARSVVPMTLVPGAGRYLAVLDASQDSTLWPPPGAGRVAISVSATATNGAGLVATGGASRFLVLVCTP